MSYCIIFFYKIKNKRCTVLQTQLKLTSFLGFKCSQVPYSLSIDYPFSIDLAIDYPFFLGKICPTDSTLMYKRKSLYVRRILRLCIRENRRMSDRLRPTSFSHFTKLFSVNFTMVFTKIKWLQFDLALIKWNARIALYRPTPNTQ